MSRYLITFDMDTNCLKDNYHGNNYNNAYYDIKNILSKHGFDNIQGSVYLGNDGISEAHGTIAIQELTAKFDWFYDCASNIKFYRLESDLNADFIAQQVHEAKQRFNKRLASIEQGLIEAGLDEAKIKDILSKEVFALEDIK
ncbi:VapD [Testudinibacter sp. TR-2022]|uniref:VapD n=1 Tax=Testudinibacter sp. TR-2022 TaxID=2585029 RepID=UPI001119B21D|nr:VapD [Testudinibacter sp. TR-2022]TNH04052.1 VapD [Pasteurellaceae bacterium Phil31]TNH10163.1 VapD [Testudinibacter sp. TR-2022]TNH13023.1 VapD [Testudinibacter sp. TR-2022]